jgi:CPA2 family monovalent cation:H+ antiporter-2
MFEGLGAILVLLALGLAVALVFQRLGASALIAYLVTGAVAGPRALALVQDNQHLLESLAQIGASLLLFAIGLELDLGGMRRRLRPVAIASSAQIGLTLAAGTLVAWLNGLALPLAVAVGACLTMTSTVMLLRVLDERKLRNREEGQLVLGVSLMQDIALGPFLVLLSLILPLAQRPPWVVIAGLMACATATVLLRRAMATAVFNRVRAAQLPELEVAFAVTVALGAATLTAWCGLGAAVGAFCAGLAFGGEENRHTVEASTRPLQRLMAILFFVSMGALFDPRFIAENPWEVASVVVVTVLLKAPLAAFALRLAGLAVRPAIGYGLLLAQMGEFSFVLAATAFVGSDDPAIKHLYQLVVAVTCISLVATPGLVLLAMPFLPRSRLDAITERGETIVVAGLGPVGNTVVTTLRRRGYPLLLVDRNERLLRPWRDTPGVRCHQGRIEDMEDWLPAIGHRPSLVVLTFPIADTSALVARRLRELAPELVIIARSPYQAQVEQLHGAGAQFVICDERATASALLPLLDQALGLVKQTSARLASRSPEVRKSGSPEV